MQTGSITSHGGNDETLQKFAKQNPTLNGVKIEYINWENPEVDSVLEKYLGKEIDEHAGNFEISTVLYLQENLVKTPPKNYPKQKIEMDWTKPVISQSQNGIVDNHPDWIISKQMGKDYVEAVAKYIINTTKKEN